jgi:hypothetical protein
MDLHCRVPIYRVYAADHREEDDMQAQPQRNEIYVMPWHITAAPDDDGLTKDCILVATMNGTEIQTISLHLADQANQM